MAKPRICKECKKPMQKGERLMEHWQHLHPSKLVEIKQWLGDEDYKLRSYEKLAQEGMQGTGLGRIEVEHTGRTKPVALGDPRDGNSMK